MASGTRDIRHGRLTLRRERDHEIVEIRAADFMPPSTSRGDRIADADRFDLRVLVEETLRLRFDDQWIDTVLTHAEEPPPSFAVLDDESRS